MIFRGIYLKENVMCNSCLMNRELNLEFVCEIENALILIILQIDCGSTIIDFFN